MISLKCSSLHWVSGESRSLSPQCGTYPDGVHLVDGDDELFDIEGESESSVLSGLAIGDTSLEFTSTSGNVEDSAIGLGGSLPVIMFLMKSRCPGASMTWITSYWDAEVGW